MREKLAYSIQQAVEVSGCSRTAIYELIRVGELVAHKRGRRTLILRVDLEDFLTRLPRLSPSVNDNVPPARDTASATSDTQPAKSGRRSMHRLVHGKSG